MGSPRKTTRSHPMSARFKALLVLLLVAAASPIAGGNKKGLAAIHKGTVELTNRCYRFTGDVYQRFSGFVIKYQMSRLCEQVIGVYSTMQEIVLPLRDSGDPPRKKACMESAKKIRDLIDTLLGMVNNMNAAGDGGFQDEIRLHLGGFADGLENIAAAPANHEIPWGEVVQKYVDSLLRLIIIVLDQIEEGVTYNIQRMNVTDLPRFLGYLDSFPAAVPVDVRRPSSPETGEAAICQDVTMVYRAEHVYDTTADPPSWLDHDVSGTNSPRPSVQKLLFTIGKALPLSYTYVSVAPRTQTGAQELTAEYKEMFEGGSATVASDELAAAGSLEVLSCGGAGTAYGPVQCLFDIGWGSMVFSVGTEPPFDGTLAVSEMSKKGAQKRPTPFVQPVANSAPSLLHITQLVDQVYKSLNSPSPDVLFVSPMVGNCLFLRQLGPSRREGMSGPPQITPKLVWVGVNPVIPPPWKFAPNFTQWHERLIKESKTGSSDESTWWLAQCSLASAVAVMEEQGYVLLHLEHTFAVFILKGLRSAVKGLLPVESAKEGSGGVSLYDHWLRGWHCSPIAKTLFGLERSPGAADLDVLQDRRADETKQREALCEYARANNLPLALELSPRCDGADDGREVATAAATERNVPALAQSWRSWELEDPPEERGKAYILSSSKRGRCLSHRGFCECFPPNRGSFCENQEPGRFDDTRDYRAVLHYLVGDKERLLTDFERTLPLLWERFNSRFDYPVVVFHDGMKPASRQRILEASKNRIWFAFVDDYTAVPAFLDNRLELNLGGYSVGYRGMCRFRSGPMFTQPVMAHFDYAWTLDTDGYFPTSFSQDPFDRMHRGNHLYGYSHISRDQASAVQHFWEFCRLYIESKGIDPKATRMIRRITDALVLRDTFWHEWNRVLFMNDIEVVKLSWFQSEEYQDFFNYLDSVGGFWLYRWGDHAVRTIAIALFMDPSALMKMEVPYGHQNTCRCGAEHADEVCVRDNGRDWWRCMSKADAAEAKKNGKIVASGDVGTVHDDLIFGERIETKKN